MKTWKKTIRIIRGVLYVTLSNVPVKKKPLRDMQPYHGRMMYRMRLHHVEDVGYCPLCGKAVTYPDEVQVHHVLPVSRFTEFRDDRRNMMVVCIACHKDIHTDPWLNIRLMTDKAEELGFDLRERFTVEEVCHV